VPFIRRPKKQKAPTSQDALVFEAQMSAVDTMAKAAALSDDPATNTQKVDAKTEDAAWTTPDPAVQPQHLAMIAQQVQQQYAGKNIPDALIEQEIKAQQTHALYPHRALTYTLGVPDDDIEAQVSKAEQVARRLTQRQQPAEMPLTAPAAPTPTNGTYAAPEGMS